MIWNQIKTAILLASLSGLLMLIGAYFGGWSGITITFIISLIINGIAYFYSDKIVLNLYGAKKLSPEQYPDIYSMVQNLVQKDNLPMPKLYIINSPVANAFATGRNPSHASIAVTTGILNILDNRELQGVLAHEISHIKNRDILISTIAATLATAIGYLANMVYYSTLFSSNNERKKGNALGLILISILLPLAATLIQLAISRSREYLADESGAKLTHDPLALADALEKLKANTPMAHLDPNNAEYKTTAHMFIVNPFSLAGLTALFSTHPPVQERVKRLYEMQNKNI